MPFPSRNIVRTWFFVLIVSITVVNVFGAPKEKKFDLKIGFDLTQGENGAPSLRIRNFEDSSEIHKRAKEEDSNESFETKPTVRVDSSSGDSNDRDDKPSDNQHNAPSSKEHESSGKSSEDRDSENSAEDRLSTRGLKAADYEPEEKRGLKKK